ncbi:uncharacterized protein LOC143282885 [Babylonia areolata]|uniref:uncharacterized protein LOC143282885 n=1 Tax=Babylonia areolata TaxID=304850 RepID=UPI003FD637D7
MLKLLLASALLALTYGADQVCKLTDGHKLQTFSKTKEKVKFGCKFHALKGTVCGDYNITLAPGLKLMPKGAKAKKDIYVLDRMYLAVKKENGDKLRCRTNMKKIGKYLDGKENYLPLKKLDGNLDLTDVYEFSKDEKKREVTLVTKNKDFTIAFGLYDDKTLGSTYFSFTCHADTFTPTNFPTQLCGNGTKKEVKLMKKAIELKGNRKAVTTLSVFSDEKLVQMDAECQVAASTMSTKCEGLQDDASKYCWPIVFKASFIKCIRKLNLYPRTVFKNCVDFVCSNYTNAFTCGELSDQLEGCPKLKGISDKVDKCSADMAEDETSGDEAEDETGDDEAEDETSADETVDETSTAGEEAGEAP